MPEIRSVIDGPLKYTKYRQAKKRRENREKRRLKEKERDRQFPQSTLEVTNNDRETKDIEVS